MTVIPNEENQLTLSASKDRQNSKMKVNIQITLNLHKKLIAQIFVLWRNNLFQYEEEGSN